MGVAACLKHLFRLIMRQNGQLARSLLLYQSSERYRRASRDSDVMGSGPESTGASSFVGQPAVHVDFRSRLVDFFATRASYRIAADKIAADKNFTARQQVPSSRGAIGAGLARRYFLSEGAPLPIVRASTLHHARQHRPHIVPRALLDTRIECPTGLFQPVPNQPERPCGSMAILVFRVLAKGRTWRLWIRGSTRAVRRYLLGTPGCFREAVSCEKPSSWPHFCC